MSAADKKASAADEIERRAKNAERQRRFRERSKTDVVCATVPITVDLSELLIESGYLAYTDTHDRDAVAEAVTAMLADIAQA